MSKKLYSFFIEFLFAFKNVIFQLFNPLVDIFAVMFFIERLEKS